MPHTTVVYARPIDIGKWKAELIDTEIQEVVSVGVGKYREDAVSEALKREGSYIEWAEKSCVPFRNISCRSFLNDPDKIVYVTIFDKHLGREARGRGNNIGEGIANAEHHFSPY